jgi:anti-anti-sigma factor
MNPSLTIVSEELTDLPIVVFKLSGRLDAGTVSQLERSLTDCFVSGRRAIVFDMSKLTYISSSGLRLLLSARTTARKHDGDIFLCALSSNVREVFEMVGFLAIFGMYDTLDQAMVAATQLVNR